MHPLMVAVYPVYGRRALYATQQPPGGLKLAFVLHEIAGHGDQIRFKASHQGGETAVVLPKAGAVQIGELDDAKTVKLRRQAVKAKLLFRHLKAVFAVQNKARQHNGQRAADKQSSLLQCAPPHSCFSGMIPQSACQNKQMAEIP